MRLDEARQVTDGLRDRMRAVVRGRDTVIDGLIVALLADGHVLLEDFPGSGKTTLAKTLGRAIQDDRPEHEASQIQGFRRIQFTPDLLPSDITGTTVFEPDSNRFTFRPGPLFAHVVLADEINRTSPKVQAATLEAMGEKQVTVDNVSHPLDDLFFVVATQNPLDSAGTYPLPIPQLDRFLFKIRMVHIDRESELALLREPQSVRASADEQFPKLRRSDILAARQAVETEVTVHDMIRSCLVDIAEALRADSRVLQGISTRALVVCLPALRVRAMMEGRDYVNAEDLEALLPLCFAHRMALGVSEQRRDAILAEAVAPAVERLARRALL
jgi:MoxR-like ATPase